MPLAGRLCSLPLWSYWYRLALAWIPRYMVACVIILLAVPTYSHVGSKFPSFMKAGSNSVYLSTGANTLASVAMDNRTSTKTPTFHGLAFPHAPSDARRSYAGPDQNHHRHSSVVPSIAETLGSGQSPYDFQRLNSPSFPHNNTFEHHERNILNQST